MMHPSRLPPDLIKIKRFLSYQYQAHSVDNKSQGEFLVCHPKKQKQHGDTHTSIFPCVCCHLHRLYKAPDIFSDFSRLCNSTRRFRNLSCNPHIAVTMTMKIKFCVNFVRSEYSQSCLRWDVYIVYVYNIYMLYIHNITIYIYMFQGILQHKNSIGYVYRPGYIWRTAPQANK